MAGAMAVAIGAVVHLDVDGDRPTRLHHRLAAAADRGSELERVRPMDPPAMQRRLASAREDELLAASPTSRIIGVPTRPPMAAFVTQDC